ncbi:hypothetical protein RvY_11542 [Ramazzottius varieornatus]|uniref:Uncharacterized protein n=1 Tax=Ramazzottius varieornatus TaxID=947166 RepID=A0A1D1VLV2_RAMVA|nr:hypothetical protein RvY_11542 [Ramazzottius varieornatus]
MDTGSVPQPKEATLMRPPYDPNATISLPAPCYLIGQMELVYIYFGAGFWIPILALIYVQFARIKRFLGKKLLQNRLTRQHVEGAVEEELEPKKKLAATGEDRFKQLIAAKAKQSRFTLAMIEAASPQSLLGQAMVRTVVKIIKIISFITADYWKKNGVFRWVWLYCAVAYL